MRMLCIDERIPCVPPREPRSVYVDLLMVSEYDPAHRIVSIFSDSVHTSTTPGSSTNPSWGEQLGMEDDPLEARLGGVEH